jgi:hypothetical protein
MIRLLPLLMLLLLGLAGPAAAMVRLPENPLPIAGNPADRLLSVPIEDSVYDLHAENRAIDWHLDASVRTDKRAAERLVRLLLAPDAAGNPQALVRRMGVEELIWDCGYWGAGMTEFDEYGPCYGKRGKLKRKVNKTVAHRDHLHIGMSKRGAAARTSFWSRGR